MGCSPCPQVKSPGNIGTGNPEAAQGSRKMTPPEVEIMMIWQQLCREKNHDSIV